MNHAHPKFEIESENDGLTLEEGIFFENAWCSASILNCKDVVERKWKQISDSIVFGIPDSRFYWLGSIAVRFARGLQRLAQQTMNCWVRKLLLRAVQTFTRFGIGQGSRLLLSKMHKLLNHFLIDPLAHAILIYFVILCLLSAGKKSENKGRLALYIANVSWLSRAGKCNRKFCKCQLLSRRTWRLLKLPSQSVWVQLAMYFLKVTILDDVWTT